MAESIYDKQEFVWGDIESLIKNQVEESINLEYKSGLSFDKNDDRKKAAIARTVSSFANSDGGIIVYGIDEEGHKPKDVSFINGNVFTKEWLENVIDGNIQQKIQNLRIYSLRKDSDLSKTVYLVRVPASETGPHMCVDKKFYRRYNYKSVPMEEYEIRMLYNRHSSAEIEYEGIKSRDTNDSDKNHIKRELFVHIKNNSRSVEKHCKLQLTFNNMIGLDIQVSYKQPSNINMQYLDSGFPMLTVYNSAPIFPGEEVAIMTFEMKINKQVYETFRTSVFFTIKTYDSSTAKESEVEISNLFKPIIEL